MESWCSVEHNWQHLTALPAGPRLMLGRGTPSLRNHKRSATLNASREELLHKSLTLYPPPAQTLEDEKLLNKTNKNAVLNPVVSQSLSEVIHLQESSARWHLKARGLAQFKSSLLLPSANSQPLETGTILGGPMGEIWQSNSAVGRTIVWPTQSRIKYTPSKKRGINCVQEDASKSWQNKSGKPIAYNTDWRTILHLQLYSCRTLRQRH